MTWQDRSRYTYRSQVAYDLVRHVIENDIDLTAIAPSELVDAMMNVDDITGNPSGSYWLNSYKAARCVAENWSDAFDAVDEMCQPLHGVPVPVYETICSPEFVDCLARCYYLPEAVELVYDWFQTSRWEEVTKFVTDVWA